jgi:hypothetical protein
MTLMTWLHQVTPILSAITMVLAIARFTTIKPHSLWSHGKNIGLIFISGSCLVAVFNPSTHVPFHAQLQLDMVQVGLFFYSWSWGKAVALCVREFKESEKAHRAPNGGH